MGSSRMFLTRMSRLIFISGCILKELNCKNYLVETIDKDVTKDKAATNDYDYDYDYDYQETGGATNTNPPSDPAVIDRNDPISAESGGISVGRQGNDYGMKRRRNQRKRNRN